MIATAEQQTPDEQITAHRDRIRELMNEAGALLSAASSEGRTLDDTERARHDAIMGSPGSEGEGEVADLERHIGDLGKLAARQRELSEVEDAQRHTTLQLAASRTLERTSPASGAVYALGSRKPINIPMPARAHRPVQYFESPEEAYAAGRWLCAVLFKHPGSQQWCREHGIPIARQDQTIGTDSEGGYLVPTPLERTMIEIREAYGVVRRFARRWPMGAETLTIPKRLTGLTSAAAAEGADILAGNETSMSFGTVALVARKWATYTQVTNELMEDAIIDMAQQLAREIALAFAYAEDNSGFNGDGTGTYNSITGVKNALLAGSDHVATGKTTFAALTFSDFETMIGALPNIQGMNPRWFIHKSAYAASMLNLLDAAGGNTIRSLEQGAAMTDDFQFLGYPGTFLNVGVALADEGTGVEGACYFGDLNLGMSLGDRRGLQVEMSRDRHFELDMTAIRGISRFDIQVHETGTASVSGVLHMMTFG